MNQTQLFSLALGLTPPWEVTEVKLDQLGRRLDIWIDFKPGSRFPCPVCNAAAMVHDTRDKQWRHLDFFQYQTFLHARVPRTGCPEHGTKIVEVPWARPGSGFTLYMEACIMTLVSVMPVATVAKHLRVTDNRLWRVAGHYVAMARLHEDFSKITRIGIDETASRRGHRYVTNFVDLDTHRVIFSVPGKGSATIKSFKIDFCSHGGDPDNITDVSIDMSAAFIKGVTEELPKAKITFDRFHLVKIVSEALDKVQRQERADVPELNNSRFLWLRNSYDLSSKQREKLDKLRDMHLKTGRAYELLLAFKYVFLYDEATGRKKLNEWIKWAVRSRLAPMVEAGRTMRRYFDGIINWFQSKVNNGILEGLNSLIQAAKARARGYRSDRNLITMIYLTVGKLKLSLPT
jgi:transposase